MSKAVIYETSFEETQFIAVTAYQNEDVCFFSLSDRLFIIVFSGEIIEN